MTIERRLTKLERQNRWMKRAGGLAFAAVACVVLMGQGKGPSTASVTAKEVTTERLTVRNPKHKGRITLSVTDSGYPRIEAVDGEDRWAFILGSSGLKFFNKHGVAIITLGANSDAGVGSWATLRLRDPLLKKDSVRPSVALSSGPGGEAVLSFLSKNPKGSAHFAVESDDSCELLLGSAAGGSAIRLARPADGPPTLVIKDKDGKVISQAPPK